MKRHILSLYALALLCAGGVTATSCSDPEEVQDLVLARVLSPTNLSARVSNDVNIVVSWDAMSGATSYELEAYADSPDYDQRTPDATGTSTETTYTFTGLEGETTYYIRVRALDETDASRTSLWSSINRATNAEQIFTRVAEADLTESSVTLRWPAGEYATVINIYKGSGTEGEQVASHNITASEVSEGAATITGLESETLYTAKMMNGTKTRGQIEFTTRIDLGGATQVDEGDDLTAMLDAAEEGESFVIMSGTFDLGTYSLTKSVSISGYSSENKPVINGNFEVASDVTIESLTLSKLALNGKESTYAYTVSAKGGLDKLNISGCDITGYKSGVIYNNSAATLGDIVIDNCLVTDILGGGGDGLDLRAGGTLGSLTVTNSTFYNGFRSFLRCQISTGSPAISFTNCTFSNISTLEVTGSNNTGLFRTANANASLTVKNCLFYQICKVDGRTGTNAGVWARTDIKGTESYANNYYFDCPYLWEAKYASGHDDVATESDPGFTDPENGDFTLTNAILIDDKVGDPRWYE